MTPAQLAGRPCGPDEDEDVIRVRGILRRGEELGQPELARELALETGLPVGMCCRLIEQAAGRRGDDERTH